MLLPSILPQPLSLPWSLPGGEGDTYGVSDAYFKAAFQAALPNNILSAEVTYSGETKYVTGPGYDLLTDGEILLLIFFSQQGCAVC